MRKICQAIIATSFLISGSAYALPLTVESFDTEQTVGLVAVGPVSSSGQVAAAGAIGGFRDMEVTSDAVSVLDTKLVAVDGELRFSNAADTTGTGYVTWDGDDSPTTVDDMGLGGEDITTDGFDIFDGIYVQIISADLPGLKLTLKIFDIFGVEASVTHAFGIVTSDAPLMDKFLFTEFGVAVDLTEVGAIQLILEGPAEIDARIDFISVGDPIDPPVPAPMTLALLAPLAGLIGIRYAKRG